MGPKIAATKRRRRREQMEEEDDSSDLSDESDEEGDLQRAAQQIKFAKMPVRNRSGSSPTQTGRTTTAPSPRSKRRGSQSALESVRERPRRDTVTSSEMSSENELDSVQRQRGASRAAMRAAQMQERIQEEEPMQGIKRVDTQPLPEEEEDSDEGSDMSGDYIGSVDSASILDMANAPVLNGSPTRQVVGTPPRNLMRQSTIRKSQAPPKPTVLEALPPRRPMSTIRPASVIQPKSLLSAALKSKEKKSSVPFQRFAHYNGQGQRGSIAIRIYPAFSDDPETPFEVLIRPRVHDGQGAERMVTVADLIGLALYRYIEEKRKPDLPREKQNINWWMLRMVEEGGEVDDDFPPFERTKALASFTTVNNANQRGGGRLRSNSTAYDEFALVAASPDEYQENKELTPQEEEEEEAEPSQSSSEAAPAAPPKDVANTNNNGLSAPRQPWQNPIVFTAVRTNTPLADTPATAPSTSNPSRGQQKLLRIHIMSTDTAAGQMVTVDVTTETYLAEVLEVVCRKRQLDKGNHVLKLPGSGAVVMIDRPVSSIGNVSDLELYRRRFATDGPLTMTGSPGSASPKASDSASHSSLHTGRKVKKAQQMLGPHPLAREIAKQDELGGNANYKKYVVWRKQPMRIVGMSERILVIDGEYIHVVPSSGGKALQDGGGKTTTVHFSNVIGCKVPRKHPTNVKVRVFSPSLGQGTIGGLVQAKRRRRLTRATAGGVQGDRDKAVRFRDAGSGRGGRDSGGAQEGHLAVPRSVITREDAQRIAQHRLLCIPSCSRYSNVICFLV